MLAKFLLRCYLDWASRNQQKVITWCGLVLWLILSAACIAGQPEGPKVTVLTPENGVTLGRDQLVTVQSISVSRVGVSRVELWVNGELIDSQSSDAPRSYTTLQPWTPAIAGTYRLEVRAFDASGVQSDPVVLSVSVVESKVDSPNDNANPPVNTRIPTITAKSNLNIRTGPDISFARIATLKQGQSAQIIGANETKSWWKIAYSGTSSGIGWVSGDEQFSTVVDVADVPIVATPLPLQTARPLPTTTPTAQTNLPVIHYFEAERQNISAGENVLLQWDLDGADAAYLYPGGEAGVVAPGKAQIKPNKTTTYRLVAQNQFGQVEAFVTVYVQ